MTIFSPSPPKYQKKIDFGLAREFIENEDIEDYIGTYRYMAPEIARLEKGGLHPKADVFRLAKACLDDDIDVGFFF